MKVKKKHITTALATLLLVSPIYFSTETKTKAIEHFKEFYKEKLDNISDSKELSSINQPLEIPEVSIIGEKNYNLEELDIHEPAYIKKRELRKIVDSLYQKINISKEIPRHVFIKLIEKELEENRKRLQEDRDVFQHEKNMFGLEEQYKNKKIEWLGKAAVDKAEDEHDFHSAKEELNTELRSLEKEIEIKKELREDFKEVERSKLEIEVNKRQEIVSKYEGIIAEKDATIEKLDGIMKVLTTKLPDVNLKNMNINVDASR